MDEVRNYRASGSSAVAFLGPRTLWKPETQEGCFTVAPLSFEKHCGASCQEEASKLYRTRKERKSLQMDTKGHDWF